MSGTQGKPANTFDQFCNLELVPHFTSLEIGSQKAGVRDHLQQAVELGQSDFHHATPPGQPPRVAGQQASSMPPSLSSLFTASSSRLPLLPYSLQSPTLPSQFLSFDTIFCPPPHPHRPTLLPVPVGLLGVISTEEQRAGGGERVEQRAKALTGTQSRPPTRMPTPSEAPERARSWGGQNLRFHLPAHTKAAPECSGKRACTLA